MPTKPRTPNFSLVAHRTEREYSSSLRQVARAVQMLLDAHTSDTVLGRAMFDATELETALRRYSVLIQPWAVQVATRMVTASAWRNKRAFESSAMKIGGSLRQEIERAPIGAVMQRMQAEQVGLIKSLPLNAAQQVQLYVRNALPLSTRSTSLIPDIRALGPVTERRARLIARTETSKAQSVLTRSRAEYAGSDGYIWRTARDQNVRDSHREMDGRFVQWNDPPTLSDGTTTHAGEIYNCRCWAEPVFATLPSSRGLYA